MKQNITKMKCHQIKTLLKLKDIINMTNINSCIKLNYTKKHNTVKTQIN